MLATNTLLAAASSSSQTTNRLLAAESSSSQAKGTLLSAERSSSKATETSSSSVYRENSPTRRNGGAPSWALVKRLRENDADGNTHVCIYKEKDSDQECGIRMKIFKSVASEPKSAWSTNVPNTHILKHHQTSSAALAILGKPKRVRTTHNIKVEPLPSAAIPPVTSPKSTSSQKQRLPAQQTRLADACVPLSKQQKQHLAVARYVVYTKHLKLNTVEDEYFRDMLKAYDNEADIPGVEFLLKFIEAEFEILLVCMKECFGELRQKVHGNHCLQLLRDDGTATGREPLAVIAVEFVDPRFEKNWVITVGCINSTEVGLSDLIRGILNRRLDIEDMSAVVTVATSNLQAVCFAEDIGRSDPIFAYAVSQSNRSRNKIFIEVCLEALDLMQRVRKTAIYFDDDKNISELAKLGGSGGRADVEGARLLDAGSGANRMSTQCQMLRTLCRQNLSLRMFCTKFPSNPVAQYSDSEWNVIRELEALSNVTRLVSTLSEFEDGFPGGYGALLKEACYWHLRNGPFEVIDLPLATKSEVPRVQIGVDELSELGNSVRLRALAECKFFFFSAVVVLFFICILQFSIVFVERMWAWWLTKRTRPS